jgi:hypothetical protein
LSRHDFSKGVAHLIVRRCVSVFQGRSRLMG